MTTPFVLSFSRGKAGSTEKNRHPRPSLQARQGNGKPPTSVDDKWAGNGGQKKIQKKKKLGSSDLPPTKQKKTIAATAFPARDGGGSGCGGRRSGRPGGGPPPGSCDGAERGGGRGGIRHRDWHVEPKLGSNPRRYAPFMAVSAPLHATNHWSRCNRATATAQCGNLVATTEENWRKSPEGFPMPDPGVAHECLITNR